MIDFDGLPLVPASVKRHRGSISCGILARDTRVHVVTLPAGSELTFSDGRESPATLSSARISKPVTIANLDLPERSELLFDEARELMAVILGADVATGPTPGLHYMTGAEIPFIDGKWILAPDDMV